LSWRVCSPQGVSQRLCSCYPESRNLLYRPTQVEAQTPGSLTSLADSNQFDEPKTKGKGTPAEWVVAARALMVSGQTETAVKLALRLWNDAAGDPEAAMLASEVLSADVPSWHFKMVRDDVRNAAYDAALRRAIRPGMRVLDIGSGTGLLAMMAARAGAARVFSCEMNPAVADAAKEIVALNGYSDRIQVLAKHSNKIDVEADLGGRVDLIVSEIVSNNLLGEGVLGTMEHAVGNLLKPGGKVIPARGTVKIALAFDPNFTDRRMDVIDGFDLSPFNRLAKLTYRVVTHDTEFKLRSDAVDLFEFDFQATKAAPKARAQRTLTAHGGPVNCIAQWIHLQMDEVEHHEVRPGEQVNSSWAIVVYPLPKQSTLKAGDELTVHASHDMDTVHIWGCLD
jgi:protein arginine N-methyltransferase 7